MKKRMFAALLLACLLLGALTACDKDEALTADEAKQIVIDHSGADVRESSDVHVHLGENDKGEVCFNVYITVDGKSYTYVVHARTGEILSITEGSSHSH